MTRVLVVSLKTSDANLNPAQPGQVYESCPVPTHTLEDGQLLLHERVVADNHVHELRKRSQLEVVTEREG